MKLVKKNKRLLSIFFLSIVLAITLLPLTALAEGELIDDETKEKLEKAEEDAGIMDGFLIGQANNLFNMGDINSLSNLIFGNPYEVWMKTDDEIHFNLFYESELEKFIKPMLGIFGATYVSFITLAIMFAAAKLSFKAYSPQSKADFWQDVQMWIISAFFMGTFWYFAQIVFGINQGFVQSLFDYAEDTLGLDMSSMSIIAQAGDFSLADIITFLVEWGLALYLNLIYIARKVIIILLIVLAPVAAISLLFARTRSFFGTYIKEFLGNVFLNSMHAMVITLFAALGSLGAGVVFKIGMLVMFIPVTGMLSRWLNLGDSSSKLGSAMGMMGMAGIAGAAMLTRNAGGVLRGRGASSGGVGTAGGEPAKGFGSDGNITSITQAAKGTNSRGWQGAKKALGIGGAIAGGAVGLGFAGPSGAVAGAVLGNKASQAVGQGARNLGVGAASTVRTAKDAYQRSGGTIQGAKQVWGDIGARREIMGNLGESVGSMIGIGGAGRSAGQALSGVSRNRLMSETYGNMNLQDLQRANPNAPMQFRQDNNGSAMYMKTGNEWMQVSPMGAADPALKPGEMRAIDYNLTSPSARGGFDGSVTQGSGPAVANVSKQGSTPYLERQSEAYIQSANGQKYMDSRMDARKINPDQYFAHNVVGSPKTRGTSDRVADTISKTNTQNRGNIVSWRAQAEHEISRRRHSGII